MKAKRGDASPVLGKSNSMRQIAGHDREGTALEG